MYGAWAPLIGLKDVWRSFNRVSSVLAEVFFMGGRGFGRTLCRLYLLELLTQGCLVFSPQAGLDCDMHNQVDRFC